MFSSNHENTHFENERFMVEKDKDLIKSEKEGLIKYLKREIVQNQEFLDHIRVL